MPDETTGFSSSAMPKNSNFIGVLSVRRTRPKGSNASCAFRFCYGFILKTGLLFYLEYGALVAVFAAKAYAV